MILSADGVRSAIGLCWGAMILELGVIALSIAGFALLDYYILGCEKV